jgi:hypothetical protein
LLIQSLVVSPRAFISLTACAKGRGLGTDQKDLSYPFGFSFIGQQASAARVDIVAQNRIPPYPFPLAPGQPKAYRVSAR